MCTAIAVKQLHVSSSTHNFQKHSATFLSSPKFHLSHFSQKLHYKDTLLFKKRHTYITNVVYSEHYKDILLFQKDIHISPMQSTQNTTKTYFYSKKTYIHHPCSLLRYQVDLPSIPSTEYQPLGLQLNFITTNTQ